MDGRMAGWGDNYGLTKQGSLSAGKALLQLTRAKKGKTLESRHQHDSCSNKVVAWQGRAENFCTFQFFDFCN